ncbi:MAG: hypothetical protein M1834_007969 [Cirrosporium novae-zelandiae]|nr:MAG: hypothetical protein M1834_007969 [Cirrosporium novae-zelandiae]
MSDSEPPSEKQSLPVEHEVALQNTVDTLFETGRSESASVKSVRTATEKRLGLPDGYFKTKFKAESKQIITEEFQKHEEHQAEVVNTKKRCPSPIDEPEPKPAKKSKKRVKPKESDDLKDDLQDSSTEKDNKNADQPESEMSEVLDEKAKPSHERSSTKDDGSESEMSEVLDEAPKKRKSRGSSKPSKAKRRTVAKGKDANLSPDEAEIKRLQSFIVKCGVRKQWGKELAPFPDSKKKIKHLKEVLSDLGMTGRLSTAKALVIKEKRELLEDSKAAMEWNESHGVETKVLGRRNQSDQNGSDNERRARRAKARQDLSDLLGSDDGQETD